ncbi:hypothetical protein STENM36S_01744 [Streptomyces tendae]
MISAATDRCSTSLRTSWTVSLNHRQTRPGQGLGRVGEGVPVRERVRVADQEERGQVEFRVVGLP